MLTVSCVNAGQPEFEAIREIRRRVFVEEQGVSPANEFDAIDQVALHLLATMDGVALGTARLYSEDGIGRIGRVAVLEEARGRGVGRALMRSALAEAERRGFGEVLLHAQVRVREFYAILGFQAEGAEYLEEGISHVSMRATLPVSTCSGLQNSPQNRSS